MESQIEAQETNTCGFNTLAVSPLCRICRVVLDKYDSTDIGGIIIESTELIENRAAQGCHLCAHFISRLRLRPTWERDRAIYIAEYLRSATAKDIDISYLKLKHSNYGGPEFSVLDLRTPSMGKFADKHDGGMLSRLFPSTGKSSAPSLLPKFSSSITY
jgi:hypothetical protein